MKVAMTTAAMQPSRERSSFAGDVAAAPGAVVAVEPSALDSG
jgi:hypothetical protein